MVFSGLLLKLEIPWSTPMIQELVEYTQGLAIEWGMTSVYQYLIISTSRSQLIEVNESSNLGVAMWIALVDEVWAVVFLISW